MLLESCGMAHKLHLRSVPAADGAQIGVQIAKLDIK